MATLYFGTTLINQADANVATVVESLTQAEYEALAVKDPNTLYVLTDVQDSDGMIKSHVENTNNPHGVTAEQVGARPDTWMPTAADVGALTKTAYEYNVELAMGSSGKVCIGKFPMYDSNVSVEIKSTTNQTYNGTLIIATQNINTSGGGSYQATVYGDASNTLTDSIKIHYGSGSNVFSVYIDLPSWSKNLLHIQCVSLASAPSSIATAVDSIPSNATLVPTNALKAQLDGKAASSHGNHVPATETANNAKFLRNDNTWQTVTPANIGASATGHKHTKSEITDFPTSMPASDVSAWAKAASKPTYTASEVGARPSTWTPSASDVGAVPTSRTVNGKALSGDITLAASDVGAATSSHTHDDRYYTETEVNNLLAAKAPMYQYSTTDIGAGASLATGQLYFVYE